MTAADVIKAAVPDATEETMSFILWGMTPYPFECSPRILYRAASRFRRASANGVTLCEMCKNKAMPDGYLCKRCDRALHPPVQEPA